MKIGSYLSKYLKAADFPAPKLLTIERVDEEDVGDEAKLVVYFAEVEQGVVLGKTTLAAIVDALGSDETDDWVGYPIVVYNDPTVMYAGKRTGGIRFRKPKGEHAAKKEIAPRPSSNGTRGIERTKQAEVDQDDLPF